MIYQTKALFPNDVDIFYNVENKFTIWGKIPHFIVGIFIHKHLIIILFPSYILIRFKI